MVGTVSGHVYRFEGKRRPVWRAKYLLPDGRQVHKTLGPAWTARGRPPEWMRHANVQTTMQYLHYVPRPEDAALVGEAFAPCTSGRRAERTRAVTDEHQR